MTRIELADAMLKGSRAPGVVEEPSFFLAPRASGCFVCALGAALLYKHGGDCHQADKAIRQKCEEGAGLGTTGIISELLEIPLWLAVEVSSRHVSGDSIEQIADWLRQEH